MATSAMQTDRRVLIDHARVAAFHHPPSEKKPGQCDETKQYGEMRVPGQRQKDQQRRPGSVERGERPLHRLGDHLAARREDQHEDRADCEDHV